ncbi:MAG: hypothetical protein Sylvanvirus10_23 [Sylvanvirus sp.]|uniref:Uncharacterized protein n=1 Tax=Sylvanvirus sp. TaxID=2487774 RepID=A0A3G5AI35_9VIRU|nr:MAG: hypothetical protein Sylvanvirus10_23 [Sylvanvirus sp.]
MTSPYVIRNLSSIQSAWSTFRTQRDHILNDIDHIDLADVQLLVKYQDLLDSEIVKFTHSSNNGILQPVYDDISTDSIGKKLSTTNVGLLKHIRSNHLIPDMKKLEDMPRTRVNEQVMTLYKTWLSQVNAEIAAVTNERKEYARSMQQGTTSMQDSPTRWEDIETASYPFPRGWNPNRIPEEQTLTSQQRNTLQNGQCSNVLEQEEYPLGEYVRENNIVILAPLTRLRTNRSNAAVCFTRNELGQLYTDLSNLFYVCAGPEGGFPPDMSQSFMRIPLSDWSVYVPIQDVEYILYERVRTQNVTGGVYQLQSTEMTLPSTVSMQYVDRIRFGQRPDIGSHHCGPGTDKPIYRLVPVHY